MDRMLFAEQFKLAVRNPEIGASIPPISLRFATQLGPDPTLRPSQQVSPDSSRPKNIFKLAFAILANPEFTSDNEA
jgi:hypothetical protein